MTKPNVTLVGTDGNAFSIISACKEAWKKAGLPHDEWDRIQDDMMSGDYDHLLAVAQEHFNVS